ncbi:MAG: hypothetical protein LBT37_00670 [Lactobacillaceae bacterium]|jgi:hypothetical protein|nr:hypothetical protein [Lactobacillaceae bacterium]
MKTRKMLSLSIKGIIVIQAILCLFMTLFFLSESYQKTVLNYTNQSPTSFKIHLKGIKNDRTNETWNYLLSQDAAIIDSGLENSKIKILVGGNVKKAPTLIFSGTELVTSNDLIKLDKSKNQDATIGKKNGSINSIKKIPHILFSYDVYFAKLAENTDVSSLGSYTIVGLTNSQRETFLNELAELSGLSKTDLLHEKNGSVILNGIIFETLIASLLITLFLFGVLTVLYTMASLKEIGTLSLMGWDKFNLVRHELGSFVTFSMFVTILNFIVGYFISGIGFKATSYYVLSGVINTALVILVIIIASLLILSVSSLSAIRGNIPKKTLYGLATVLYLFLSVGLVSVCGTLDTPLNEIKRNNQMLSYYNDVKDYETLKEITPGENQSSMIGLNFNLSVEFWNWYKSIEGKNGVYIASGMYYSKDYLQARLADGENLIPKEPYSSLIFSPNYLKDNGINLDIKDEKDAKAGIRVYMIPDTWQAKRVDDFRKWTIKEDIDSPNESDINNVFAQNPRVKFTRYHVDEPIFTWFNEKGEPRLDDSPVIMVSTASNMMFMDYANLGVNSFNGPLKFKNKDALKRSTTISIMKKNQLDDNELKFVPIEKYIDYLQEGQYYTIILFCGVIMLIVLAILLIVLSITFIFSVTNERVIFIKEILGFSKIQIYWKLLTGIIVIGGIELLAALLLNYQFGILLILFNIITQLLVLYLFIKVHGVKKAKES